MEVRVPWLERWNRTLSEREVWQLCLLALGLHVLPLILADYPYLDDVWRSQLSGIWQDPNDSWAGQGRVLIEWFYAVIGFSSGALNLFPWPVLVAAVMTAGAMAGLVRHYFEAPRVTCLFVVWPLWFNPFFLQNLSYQYDAPVMALALAACMAAITLRGGRRYTFVGSSVLVAIAIGLYQVSINVFAGLCCIEIVRLVLAQERLAVVGREVLIRLGQVLCGCLLYVLTAYQLMTVARDALLPIDAQWPGEMVRRGKAVVEHVGLLITPETCWFFLGLIVLALLALVAASKQVLCCRDRPGTERLALVVILLLAVGTVLLLIPGMTLLFLTYNGGARLLLGAGPAWVLLALLARHWLVDKQPVLAWLLAIPVLFMLTFSFAYGRVLVAKKEFEQLITFSIAQAISSTPTLYEARRFHIVPSSSSAHWLPAAEGAFRSMPALDYVLNNHALVLAEMMPRVGMPAFGGRSPMERREVLSRSPTPIVDAKFFAIHRCGDIVYVLMKQPFEDPRFIK